MNWHIPPQSFHRKSSLVLRKFAHANSEDITDRLFTLFFFHYFFKAGQSGACNLSPHLLCSKLWPNLKLLCSRYYLRLASPKVGLETPESGFPDGL